MTWARIRALWCSGGGSAYGTITDPRSEVVPLLGGFTRRRVPHTWCMHPERFFDDRRKLVDFEDDILVQCPRCGKSAHVTPVPENSGLPDRELFAHRLVCGHCGLARTKPCLGYYLSAGASSTATDPYFKLPLRLRAEIRHGWLWAYNFEHLSLIRCYVQASLREHAPWDDGGIRHTAVARLPKWIKSAKHRAEIVREIDHQHRAAISDAALTRDSVPVRTSRVVGGSS